MMHTSTSPSYPIVASIETAAAMLRGNSGKRLIQRSIERALHFRKEVQRLREEADGWFFDIWQPEEVDEAQCWPVSGEAWHGFRDADDDHMFLDPVKVTILTPGMDEQGNMAEEGSRPRWWPNSSMSAAWWWRKPGLTICCSCSVSVSIKPGRWACCAV